MKDRFLQPGYLHKFKSGFYNSTVKKLETAGHFPQEEQPAEVAHAIDLFIHSEKTKPFIKT